METPSHIPEVIVTIGISQMLPGQIGLFAARDLAKHSILAPASEFEVFHWKWDELEKLDSITRERIIGFCVGTPSGFFAPRNLNHISIVWHMNHSCEPNVGIDEGKNFVLMKDVKAKEELFWDYGFAETNPKFAMSCNCMAKNCRKTITGKDWEDSEYRRRNIDFFLPSLRNPL